MSGGIILGGEAWGVKLGSNATFTMSGGVIGNGGSGVIVGSNATFTMSGGAITGNTITIGSGGGVCVSSEGTFTMSGGLISGNTAPGGGGVYVDYFGTLTMSGGEISGNTASYSGYDVGGPGGGGVSVYSHTFTISGEMYVAEGTFTMSGGVIAGNTAFNSGGGVHGPFKKEASGVIYGYTPGDPMSNKVTNADDGITVYTNRGSAAYIFGPPVKRRESTAGESVALDSTISGSAGGWED
jgi:hypothetical protein